MADSDPEVTTEYLLEMSNGCLNMVAEILAVHLGESAMERTPPMFYPEAIQTAINNAVNRVRSSLEVELAVARERVREMETGLDVAIRWIESDAPQIGWNLDRLREVAAPTSAAHTWNGGEP